MELILLVECAIAALYGVLIPSIPRVPRRNKPSRPSGADKEKERAQNEGSRGIGLAGRPLDRANGGARRHGSLVTLVFDG
jgi:hypothetical protein